MFDNNATIVYKRSFTIENAKTIPAIKIGAKMSRKMIRRLNKLSGMVWYKRILIYAKHKYLDVKDKIKK